MTTPVRGEADMQPVVSRSAFQVLVEQSVSSVSCIQSAGRLLVPRQSGVAELLHHFPYQLIENER